MVISPWCYTTDPEVRYDFCDIPKCGSIQTTDRTTTEGTTTSEPIIHYFPYSDTISTTVTEPRETTQMTRTFTEGDIPADCWDESG